MAALLFALMFAYLGIVFWKCLYTAGNSHSLWDEFHSKEELAHFGMTWEHER